MRTGSERERGQSSLRRLSEKMTEDNKLLVTEMSQQFAYAMVRTIREYRNKTTSIKDHAILYMPQDSHFMQARLA